MEKDFEQWNSQKKDLELKDQKLFFKEAEIWWCAVGVNIGNEACGKGETFRRPVLVLKKLSANCFIGIPLSSKVKSGSWFTNVIVNGVTQYILLYQIRMFNINRLQRRLASLDKMDFIKLKEKLELLLEL